MESWKRLAIGRNGSKFGTCGPSDSIFRVLFRSGLLISFWGHSVHFAKFLLNPSKLYGKHGNWGWRGVGGGIQAMYYFFGDPPKIKKHGTWNFLLPQDHMGPEISKHYFPTVFIQCQSNFMRGTLAASTFLGNREFMAPQIRSMNNRFHSEAKLPWSYDYILANHSVTNKSSANEMLLFSRLYSSFGYLRKLFPPRVLKYSLTNF